MNEHDLHLGQRGKRWHFLKGLRTRRTKRGKFESKFVHLDHAAGYGQRRLEASDNGAGAENIRAAAEYEPLWRRLWRREVRKLTPRKKRILEGLLQFRGVTFTAQYARVTRKTVRIFKNSCKKIFAQCFRAWKRDFGG